MMRYAIVIEKTPHNYSAYAPDLPGCAATGATLAEVQQQIKEAIEFHLEGLRKDGLLIPQPTTLCEYVIERFLVKQ
ncbi:type II toxin-antitoxin system HicB family antitoxin [Microcoleus sp. AT3-A2]|uniref:type II toxin-antitoxin system HicB family antitoxin n=1 Tax=Microcoleus sp. AT3-A2 TaxID=2818610 RepID=UPI002FD1D88E